MQLIDEDTITQAVIARHAQVADPRLRDLMTSLVQHLHAFAREVRLTEPEWQAGLRLLAEAGRLSQGPRQELALLSDALGLSTLVTAMASRRRAGGTESTVGAPDAVDTADTADGTDNEPPGDLCFVRGQVRAADGRPLPGAQVCLGDARLQADEQGRFQGHAQAAAARRLPTDGPIGALLRSLGRSAWRPAHLAVQVQAAGCRPLRTQLFRRGDQPLDANADADAAFGARRPLVADWQRHEPGRAPDGRVSARPFYTVDFDFVLEPA